MVQGAFLAEFRPPRRRPVGRAVLGAVLCLVAGGGVLFAASLFWLPRTISYRIEDGVLTVEARYSVITQRRRVALTDVEQVEAVKLRGGRRLNGTAMPGFCVGTFSYQGVGKVWQATNCSPAALVVRARGLEVPVVVTPPNRRAFVEAMSARDPWAVTPAPVKAGEGMAIIRWALALAVAGLPFLPALLFLAPGRLRYTVRPGELEVAGLVRRRRWPLAGVAVRRFRPTAVFRLMGTAVPGYYIGLFRMAGTTVRVAATHLEEGVLVEGRRPLFVTPADVDGFLAALQQAGAVVGSSA
jgi:hypothetical protein